MNRRDNLDQTRLCRSRRALPGAGRAMWGREDSFECLHCHYQVSTEPRHAGVQNRNHCPYCLYSRHVDWKAAGDRLAVCRAEMQPVGLAVKLRRKKYASTGGGELMLVHLCRECGKVSLNRLAADDDPEKILEVFESSLAETGILWTVELGEVNPLRRSETWLVETQLFGRT